MHPPSLAFALWPRPVSWIIPDRDIRRRPFFPPRIPFPPLDAVFGGPTSFFPTHWLHLGESAPLSALFRRDSLHRPRRAIPPLSCPFVLSNEVLFLRRPLEFKTTLRLRNFRLVVFFSSPLFPPSVPPPLFAQCGLSCLPFPFRLFLLRETSSSSEKPQPCSPCLTN